VGFHLQKELWKGTFGWSPQQPIMSFFLLLLELFFQVLLGMPFYGLGGWLVYRGSAHCWEWAFSVENGGKAQSISETDVDVEMVGDLDQNKG